MAPKRDTPHHARALATSGGRHPARSLTAAAQRIDLTSDRDRKSVATKAAEWQKESWAYFDLVPEVKFAARFLGSALGRLLLFPGIRLSPDEEPANLRDVLERQTLEAMAERRPNEPEYVPWAPGLTEAMVDAAEEELARLRNQRDGQAGLMRTWGVCLTIPGDSWLVGTDVELPDGGTAEEWQVLSDRNVSRRGNQVMLQLAPGARPEPLSEEATLIRVWRPHEAWPQLADSNMRAVLDVCEELLIYSRQFRSVGKSRNNAGALLLPTELDFAAEIVLDEDGVPVQSDDMTPMERDLIKSMVTPVEDDGSASAVVPHIIRGASEHLKEVRHLAMDRQIDKEALPRVTHLISRLAHGLDVPAEVLTGIGDLNHWSAWQVQDATYQAHIEPLAMLPAGALTIAYLRPMLAEHPAWNNEAGRRILDRVEVGLDPSQLVVRPNRAQDAKDAHNSLALSHQALRKYLGFSEADAPSDEELMRRYASERGIGSAGLTREVIRGLFDDGDEVVSAPTVEDEEGGAPADGSAPAPAPADQPTPDTEPAAIREPLVAALDRLAGDHASPMMRLVMVAAAQGNLGSRLAGIDQRLRDRLQVAAADAVADAVRVAGNRLRARAKNDGRLATRQRIAPEEVGPALQAAGTLTAEDEDQALEGALTPLAALWDEWVRQAQQDARRTVAATTGADPAVLDDAWPTEQAATEDRDAGWALLFAALVTVARDQIRGQDPDTTRQGERSNLGVETGPVREAMARAGGAVEPLAPPATTTGPGAAGGVATGPAVLDAAARVGYATVGWEWATGAPSRPFEPHRSLEGVQFTDWSDPQLASAGWPGFGFYFPGDHKGCTCDAVPVMVAPGQAMAAAAR